MKVGSNQHLIKVGFVLAAATLAACGDRAATYLDEADSYEQVYAYDKAAARYEVVDITSHEQTLEEIFLTFYGKGANNHAG